MHTFSPAKMWIAGLVALQKPLLHLHSQFHRELPWSEIDMDYMNLHQSAHGDREFAHLLTRMRVRRKTVAGHVDDPGVGERIGTWVRAAAGWHEAHSLRVVRFGDNMRDVAVTDGDKVEAQVQLGFSVDGHGVGDLVAASSAAPPEIVEALLTDYADAVRARCRASPWWRAARLARCGRSDRSRIARVPRRPRQSCLHRHLRGSARHAAAPGNPASASLRSGRRCSLQ